MKEIGRASGTLGYLELEYLEFGDIWNFVMSGTRVFGIFL